jgi:hypothetical protein
VDFERFCFVPHGFLVGVTSSLIFFLGLSVSICE